MNAQPESLSDRAKLFVLDTNVLMHDPSCLFRFQEHSLFIPMVVLEELDASKKGVSEVARNARQVSRFLDTLIDGADHETIELGLPISAVGNGESPGQCSGRLYLQTRALDHDIPAEIPGNKPDNNILGIALSLQKTAPESHVTLVSKDINLRIKARALGIPAEDYSTDKVLDDVNLLYTGTAELPVDFWQDHGKDMACWQDGGQTYYSFTEDLLEACHPQMCLYSGKEDNQGFEAIVRATSPEKTIIRASQDFRTEHNAVWGITARNREQNFALNLLMDPEVDFVSLLGTAGTGKTLLALAAGLTQTMDMKRYREIVMTRVTVPVGEDIGFLPGTEEEKMTPWMGALMDNLEVLTQSDVGGEWERQATAELLQKRIKIRSLNFMRGRTFLNRYLIIDEAQNLTSKQMKTLITRAGPGTKLVCLGNIAQIDTPYLSETTSGLTYVVDRFKDWDHSGHIILMRGERSRLADFASSRL